FASAGEAQSRSSEREAKVYPPPALLLGWRRGQDEIDQPEDPTNFLLCRAKLHQQSLVGRPLALQLLQSPPQPFELATTHRTLFADARLALDENIQIILLRQEFDLH